LNLIKNLFKSPEENVHEEIVPEENIVHLPFVASTLPFLLEDDIRSLNIFKMCYISSTLDNFLEGLYGLMNMADYAKLNGNNNIWFKVLNYQVDEMYYNAWYHITYNDGIVVRNQASNSLLCFLLLFS
jgi:hypothetical protein